MSITEKIRAAAARLHPRPAPTVADVREPTTPRDVQGGSARPYLPRSVGKWLPFADLTPCEQATRVGARVEKLMVENHLTAWGLAEAAETQSYAPTPQDITNLVHGMRHLRGAPEVRALADALGVPPLQLVQPGWGQ